MLRRRIGSAAAAALLAATVGAAVGSRAAPAPASTPPPCDETTQTPPECVDTTTTASTTDTLATVETPEPPTSQPVETVPAPAAAATTRSATTVARPPAAPTTTTASRPAPRQHTTARTPTAGGSGGARAGGPTDYGMPTLSGGPYVFPVLAKVSFGDTWGAARSDVGWHHGVDVFAARGAPVVAVADGVLLSVGWNTIGGRRLWLRDRAGDFFYYAHLSRFASIAVEGARVRAGTVIGFVGSSGDAAGTPSHLHFEIHPASLVSVGYDGAVDPFPYLSAWQRLTLAEAASRVAAVSSGGPPPAAILVGYVDISNTEGLSRADLKRTLHQPIVIDASAAAPAAPSRASARIAPPRPADVRLARALDAAARRPAVTGSSVWDELSSCESGGNWSAKTGNGYVGGLQFLPQTWSAHGGNEFAPSPEHATREAQIAVAERVLATQGWSAWPACSARLGLNRAPSYGWRVGGAR